MQSIFDEEAELLQRRTRYVMPILGAPATTPERYMFPELPRAMYEVDDKRKRTRAEALSRLYSIRPQTENLPYGVQRALRRPLMIYEASLWLAAGLVLVDPLDRLDGVI
jgi:hypothetical protein